MRCIAQEEGLTPRVEVPERCGHEQPGADTQSPSDTDGDQNTADKGDLRRTVSISTTEQQLEGKERNITGEE